jgi:hypothetical protein
MCSFEFLRISIHNQLQNFWNRRYVCARINYKQKKKEIIARRRAIMHHMIEGQKNMNERKKSTSTFDGCFSDLVYLKNLIRLNE